jgi:phosphoenolpyruvate carboxylase
MRAELERAKKAVLNISGHQSLQANNPVLLRSLAARNPYVDCLNMLQVELLARLRESVDDDRADEEKEQILQDALLLTINGVANGMRNSG